LKAILFAIVTNPYGLDLALCSVIVRGLAGFRAEVEPDKLLRDSMSRLLDPAIGLDDDSRKIIRSLLRLQDH
jgi:hypothetical protein